MSAWGDWVQAELGAIAAAGRWRELRSFDAFGPEGVLGGRPVVSFASNDYLGLSAHPVVVAAARDAAARWGSGATASRLIVGSRPVHHELEAELADWRGTDAALVFPTGFAANLSVLTVLGGPDVTVFSDELNHASIIDGCRLGRARVERYAHNDLDELVHGLARASGRVIVVTDTVFSMDGDVARVAELLGLCARHGALLVLDEAHAVLGPDLAVPDGVDVVRVGTLSKALGSLGGFVAASRPVVDLLVNRARPFIFTTGLTPADGAAALAALRIVRSDEGRRLKDRVRENTHRLRAGHPSPIVPIVVGDEDRAVKASAALLERGVFVPAIRPPTVAPGTCRLRVACSAAHTRPMMDQLVAALDALGLAGGARP